MSLYITSGYGVPVGELLFSSIQEELDLSDLDTVLACARAMGWIGARARVTATLTTSGDSIIVQLSAGNSTTERCYERSERWIFDFLRELSQGQWRVGQVIPGATKAGASIPPQ